jgi:hypothetical protein
LNVHVVSSPIEIHSFESEDPLILLKSDFQLFVVRSEVARV